MLCPTDDNLASLRGNRKPHRRKQAKGDLERESTTEYDSCRSPHTKWYDVTPWPATSQVGKRSIETRFAARSPSTASSALKIPFEPILA
jgi:hypothetical protein